MLYAVTEKYPLKYVFVHQFCGVMVKVMVCEIVVSEFEFQSRYYVHFQTNTLRKDMNLIFISAIG